MSATAIDQRNPARILAVDDHPLTRDALARLVAELGDGIQLLEAECIAAAEDCLNANPDVSLVVLETALPDSSGMDGLARLQRQRPGLPMIVLSSQDDPASARAALDAGARGFISKRSSTRVLFEALRLVLVGGVYVPPQVLQAAPTSERPAGASLGAGTPDSGAFKSLALTPRQRDVLTLLMQGKPNKTICRELALAEGTVKTHTAAIYRALGVTNRTQAVYAMNRLGIQLPPAARHSEPATPLPAVGREPRPSAGAPVRVRAAAEALRTVASRFQAADGGGRWAAMLGFQPA